MKPIYSVVLRYKYWVKYGGKLYTTGNTNTVFSSQSKADALAIFLIVDGWASKNKNRCKYSVELHKESQQVGVKQS